MTTGILPECAGEGCPCREDPHVHPPVVLVFSPLLGEYVVAVARCTARDTPRSEHVCGQPVRHWAGDVGFCEYHFGRLREWMESESGRLLAMATEDARLVHEEQMRLDRERAEQQRNLDQMRIDAINTARAKHGVIYYVQREDGMIKIGTSKSPRQRIGDLRQAFGPLRVLAIRHGGDWRQEHKTHARFAALRIGNSEWFRPELPLLKHVASLRRTHELGVPGLPMVGVDEIREMVRGLTGAA